MKKITSILLIVGLVAIICCFAACGNKNNSMSDDMTTLEDEITSMLTEGETMLSDAMSDVSEDLTDMSDEMLSDTTEGLIGEENTSNNATDESVSAE